MASGTHPPRSRACEWVGSCWLSPDVQAEVQIQPSSPSIWKVPKPDRNQSHGPDLVMQICPPLLQW